MGNATTPYQFSHRLKKVEVCVHVFEIAVKLEQVTYVENDWGVQPHLPVNVKFRMHSGDLVRSNWWIQAREARPYSAFCNLCTIASKLEPIFPPEKPGRLYDNKDRTVWMLHIHRNPSWELHLVTSLVVCSSEIALSHTWSIRSIWHLSFFAPLLEVLISSPISHWKLALPPFFSPIGLRTHLLKPAFNKLQEL